MEMKITDRRKYHLLDDKMSSLRKGQRQGMASFVITLVIYSFIPLFYN